MATEKDDDLIEAMISTRISRRVQSAVASAVKESVALDSEVPESFRVEPEPPAAPHARPAPPKAPKVQDIEGRLEVRPIGTAQGFRELHILHKRTWDMLNVHQKRVTMILWPLAFHFGLYQVKPGQEKKRPPLVAAFWARCLADAPLTLGHLYPPQIFKGLYSEDIWEFGGMVVDPTFQGKGLMRALSDTAKLFLFSRRPKLIITNPVEPLYELYKQLGLKTVGKAPVKYPYVDNANVWLMYGDFDELAKPYFM